MKIFCSGAAKIAHKQTNKVFDISINELDWEEISENKSQGLSVSYVAEIDHEALGPISWEVTEYPVGFQNPVNTNPNGHTVISDFQYGLAE